LAEIPADDDVAEAMSIDDPGGKGKTLPISIVWTGTGE
jgi:hypothetical protein